VGFGKQNANGKQICKIPVTEPQQRHIQPGNMKESQLKDSSKKKTITLKIALAVMLL